MFGVILGLVSWPLGLIPAALVAAIWLFVAFKRAPEVVLDLCEAEAADERTHSRLFNTTSGLCVAMGVAPPNLYVVDDPAINAMAVGVDPRSASVAVTSGALESLNLVELEALIGLLLYRIKTGAIAAETLIVPTFGAFQVLGEAFDGKPWIARIFGVSSGLYMKTVAWLHSSDSELEIDLEAVLHTRFPPALAGALEHSKGKSTLAVGSAATAHLWVASPVSARSFPAVIDIHAPLEERIAVLHEL